MDIGTGRIIKHNDPDFDYTAHDDKYAYLVPHGSASASGYLYSLPYFDLGLEVGSDTEDEFLCMKSGM